MLKADRDHLRVKTRAARLALSGWAAAGPPDFLVLIRLDAFLIGHAEIIGASKMSQFSRVYDRSRVPLYIQVASVMRRRIETKQWPPGTKIPTLVELEHEFQVARVTVRQAVDILREEGLLRAQQGRGTFAAENSAERHWFKLATTWDALIEQIQRNVLKPMKVGNPPRFPTLREGEGEPAHKYVFLRSVQYKDATPYGIVNLHLANAIYRRAPNAFREHPALSVIAGWKDFEIQHAHQTVVIGSADPTSSDLLQIALGAPTAECRCVLIDRNGVATYVADIVYRSDAIQLHIDLLTQKRVSAGAGGREPPGAGRSRRGSRLQSYSS